MKPEIRRKLPKAALFHIGWNTWKAPWPTPWFAKWRLANCVRLHIGRLVIHVRAPWLEHSARQMHPHLFR